MKMPQLPFRRVPNSIEAVLINSQSSSTTRFLALVLLLAFAGIAVQAAPVRAPSSPSPQRLTRGWPVTIDFPAVFADGPNGTRVRTGLGNVRYTYEGLGLVSDSIIAVCTDLWMSPGTLAAGTYRLTVKIQNGQLRNTLKAFTTQDRFAVPNPRPDDVFVSSCDIAPGSVMNPSTTECSFTFNVAKEGHLYAYVTTSSPGRFVGIRFGQVSREPLP
jgi:hypothetical protein